LQSFLRGFLPVLLYAKCSATEIGSVFFVASAASLFAVALFGSWSEVLRKAQSPGYGFKASDESWLVAAGR
jgi:hypothetical protein